VMQIFHVESRSTIYRWVDQGHLPPPVKKWGSPMWSNDQIEATLAEKPAESPVSEKFPVSK
jgi:predicted DNA-binding transcriptional regulator AlpA